MMSFVVVIAFIGVCMSGVALVLMKRRVLSVGSGGFMVHFVVFARNLCNTKRST